MRLSAGPLGLWLLPVRAGSSGCTPGYAPSLGAVAWSHLMELGCVYAAFVPFLGACDPVSSCLVVPRAHCCGPASWAYDPDSSCLVAPRAHGLPLRLASGESVLSRGVTLRARGPAPPALALWNSHHPAVLPACTRSCRFPAGLLPRIVLRFFRARTLPPWGLPLHVHRHHYVDALAVAVGEPEHPRVRGRGYLEGHLARPQR